MNILVVCHYGLYCDLSFSFVHNQLKEYAAMGHRVRVLIPNGVGKTGRDDRRIGKTLIRSLADGVELYDLRYVTISSLGENWFNVPSAIAAVKLHWKALFADFQPDVIHAHTLGFDSEIGAWLKKKFSCPLVVTTHGSDTFIPYTKGKTKDLKIYADKADVVVCVSSLLRRRLEECGISTRMDVILNGFNVQHIRKTVRELSCSVIQVGGLIPRKKTDVTIRAFAKLKESYPEAKLVIVGAGPERENLEKLSETLSLQDCVEFTGQVPNQEVHRRLAEASFFVMPSVREGFGIVYLEAMASGCTVIGTEGEGIADLVTNGENGYLVPPEDPDAIANIIHSCICDPEKTAEAAARGRQAAVALTWEKNARQYTSLFNSLPGKET